jgi:hypothetical protein
MASTLEIIIKVTDKFTGAFKEAEAKMKSLKEVGQQLSSIGAGLTVGVTLPLAAIGAASVKAASDLSETVNKVNVVFGESAQEIMTWGKTAATSLGMSQQQALEAAGTFGNLFTSMKMGQGVSAEMSRGLVDLSADLASFNNLDPAMVLEKLRSGIVGETEPLRTLGVNITEAAVQTKALEMGLASAGEELTTQQKVLARYAIIMEQTANAQGDFGRTSDGLANQTRILKAQFSDAAAMLGQNLLPMALQVVQALNGMLTAFNSMPQPMQGAVIGIGLFLAALGPIVGTVGTVMQAVVQIKALGAAATALGVSVPALGAFATGLKGIGAAALAATGPFIPLIAAISALVWLLNTDFGKSGITAGKQLLVLASGGLGDLLGGKAYGDRVRQNNAKSMGLPGFANGFSGVVGGSGGTDSQLVQFMGTPGEPVLVGKRGAGGGMTVIIQAQTVMGDNIERVIIGPLDKWARSKGLI